MKLFCLTIMLSLGFSFQASAHGRYIPEKFEEVDKNKDGIISVHEVKTMIDGFLIGTHDHGVMYIHELIDFFFEQP